MAKWQRTNVPLSKMAKAIAILQEYCKQHPPKEASVVEITVDPKTGDINFDILPIFPKDLK